MHHSSKLTIVKAIRGKIILELRNGIELNISEDISIEMESDEKYGYIYSTAFGRYSSVFAEISNLTQEGKETVIRLDTRVAGEIGDGEEVNLILSTKPPEAERVYLAIPSNLPLPQGDWSSVVREGNEGKVLDYGNKLSFVVPSELTEPFVVQGQIVFSLPYPPAIISEGTKFHIVKKDHVEFTDLLNDAYKSRRNRSEDLEKGVQTGYYEMLVALKNNELESIGRSLKYTAQPKVVFEAIKSAFTSYLIIQEKVTLDTDNSFAANIMVVTDKNLEKMQIVEAIITGSENQGILAIWVYGQNLDSLKERLQKEVLPKLNQLIEGVKEGPELIDMYCAGNCGELLKIDDADDSDIIKCPACDTLNMTPSRLRIH